MPLRPRLIVKSVHMRPTFRGGPWGGRGRGRQHISHLRPPASEIGISEETTCPRFSGTFYLGVIVFLLRGDIKDFSLPPRPGPWKPGSAGEALGGVVATFSSSGGRTRGHVSESSLGFEGLGSTLIFPHLKNFS